MSYPEFDDFILGIGHVSDEPNGFTLLEAGRFLSNLQKLAADIEAQPEPLESEFAAPAQDVVQTCLAIAAQLLHAHTAYTVYGAALRGPSYKALADEFADIAAGDLDDVKYFMTRANVIADGAPLQLPVVPSPPALDDEVQMIQHIIAGSDRLISLLKTLRVQVGEHPMKYTVEAQIDDEQAHYDRLVKLLPRGTPHTSTPAQKVSHLVAAVKRASAEAVVNAEVVGAMQQAKQESAFFQQQVAAQQQATAQVQQQLEQVSAQAQQAQQQLQMVQQQADMQAQQAQQATQMATQAQTEAAANAEAKMRLAMRIQQFRQQIADALAQDPVQEEGAMPEPGMPTTQTAPQQQAAAEQQAMAEQQGAAQPASSPASSRAAKETEQAQRAQADAEKQTAQAQQAQQEDAAKGKVAGLIARLKTAAPNVATVVSRGGRGGRAAAGPAKSLMRTFTNTPEGVEMNLADRMRRALSMGIPMDHIVKRNSEIMAAKALPPQLYAGARTTPAAAVVRNTRPQAPTAAERVPFQAVLRGTSPGDMPRNTRRVVAAPRPSRPALKRTNYGIDLNELKAYAAARGHDVSGIKTAAIPLTKKWFVASAGAGLAEGLQKNPEHAKALGSALAQGMADNKAALTSMAETTGHSFGSQASKAVKDAEILEKATEMAGKLGRGARNVAIGGGALGALYLTHKGLGHYSKLKGQAQEQRRLDQQERLLAALEHRGNGAPKRRAAPRATELPGAPVRNTIQPRFSSNTDVGTMS